MSPSASITVPEVTALLTLCAEVAEMPLDPMARRRHALQGLLRVLGASSAMCFERPRQNPRQWAISDTLVHVVAGADPDALARCTRARVTGSAALPIDPSALPPRPVPYSVRRGQIIDDATWYGSDHYRLILQPMGVDDAVYACVSLADGTQLCMGFHRAAGRAPFTDHHCHLLNLFHASCAHLYAVAAEAEAKSEAGDEPAEEAPAGADAELQELPPRLRSVLNLLLIGDSEKQVAFKLGLSRHTVHTYAKEIYRKLCVSSRGELLAKFIRRASRRAPVRQPMALAS